MSYLNIAADGANVGNNNSSLAEPGDTRTYLLYADREGTFTFRSMGALVGGEGHGGSTVLGLFGAINIQPRGARWYRSR